MSEKNGNARPPRDGLIRARPGLELRASEDGMPTMTGHFAVFDQWTEIDSIFEGRFLERFSPGAFKKTIQEQRDSMRVLFQHGHDPHVGDKPLGAIASLEEDETGARYEVPLLDAEYVREILPGLQAGLYGASFRFSVVKEQFDKSPEKSEHNPEGIPERTVQEARVPEFGPVTFPAYEGASAGVRSMTDELIFERMAHDPERMRQLLDFAAQTREDPAPEGSPEDGTDLGEGDEPEPEEEGTPQEEPEDSTPEPGSRTPLYDGHQKEKEPWRL